MILPWLFNIFIDRCMREMKAKLGNVDAILKMQGMKWAVVACLFAESEEEFQRVVNEFYSVCMRRKLKVNTWKNEVMFIKRGLEEARKKFLDKKRWKFLYHDHTLGEYFWRK